VRPTAIAAAFFLTAVIACDPAGEGARTAAGENPAAAEREAARLADAAADSAEKALAPVPHLASDERGDLRRSLNPVHLASAREHGIAGIRDSSQVARLVERGDLVPLRDSTEYWVVRELTHSMPFVTPDAHAMLEEIGRRLQSRLDSLGIPHYRFEITSVLRTAALQASLRRRNSNASRSTSSHEFGTTVDIAYTSFAAPARPITAPGLSGAAGVEPGTRQLVGARVRDALEEVAEDRSAELEAILGRVLTEMQDESRLHALRERSQAVFHITVDATYPAAGAGTTDGAGVQAR